MKRNLIGISGKIGSGKDTVGSIIQYLTSEAYTVRDRSYQSFLRGHQNPDTFGHYYYSPWKIKKFAYKLKEIASILTGINIMNFEDQEFKKTDLPHEWDTWYPNLDRPEPMTVRTLLQKIGTDCMRDCLHKNVWVNALFAKFRPNVAGEDFPSHWLVTDCRFPNEAVAIKERNGILIRVTRPGEDPGTHESETALDNWDFDIVIENNGSIEDLIEKVKTQLADII